MDWFFDSIIFSWLRSPFNLANKLCLEKTTPKAKRSLSTCHSLFTISRPFDLDLSMTSLLAWDIVSLKVSFPWQETCLRGLKVSENPSPIVT